MIPWAVCWIMWRFLGNCVGNYYLLEYCNFYGQGCVFLGELVRAIFRSSVVMLGLARNTWSCSQPFPLPPSSIPHTWDFEAFLNGVPWNRCFFNESNKSLVCISLKST